MRGKVNVTFPEKQNMPGYERAARGSAGPSVGPTVSQRNPKEVPVESQRGPEAAPPILQLHEGLPDVIFVRSQQTRPVFSLGCKLGRIHQGPVSSA